MLFFIECSIVETFYIFGVNSLLIKEFLNVTAADVVFVNNSCDFFNANA